MTTDPSELKSYEARFYALPTDELQENAARKDACSALLPRVHARTAKEAAELASAWYGEADRVGSDGSSVLLEDRVVEVRQDGGPWQRFVVSKRLVVERTATQLPPRGSWLELLHAVWTRCVAPLVEPSCGIRVDELEEVLTWRSGGKALFVVFYKLAEGGLAQARLELDAECNPIAFAVLEALLPEYFNLRDGLRRAPPSERGESAAVRALQTTWEGMTESDRARHERVERIVDGLRLSVADWQQLMGEQS